MLKALRLFDRPLETGSFLICWLLGTSDLHSGGMNQPSLQKLRSLRLDALARDDRAVADLNARISNSPDYLVEELMNKHGWPAHEALCAVQQLQEKVLRNTTEQAAA